MHANDLLVYNGAAWKAVETVCEGLPEPHVVPSLAFVIEAVDPIDGSALVISAEQEEVLGVLALVGQQQADGFQTLLPSVYIVAEEEIV
eukprot:scaffold2128_cov371-Prasinococcus_capsulatus_cf.AAC.4